jgi:hypothetical protein
MKDSVKIISNRLFTNYAMSFINLDCRSGKLALRNTPICRVITGTLVDDA